MTRTFICFIRLIYALLYFLALPAVATAGNYAASFLDIGVGARALGMGGAFSGLADDATAFYWNPAGLSFLESTQISGMYAPQYGSVRNPMGTFHYLGFSQPLIGGAAIGFNWIRLSVDDIPVYSELPGSYWDRIHDPSLRPTGEPEGYLSDTEDAFFFTFSKMNRTYLDMGWKFHQVRVDMPVGINIKWIRQSVGDVSATGLGLDIGAQIRMHVDDLFNSTQYGKLCFGFHLRDITKTTLSWQTRHKDSIPLNFIWGMAYYFPLAGDKHALWLSYDHESRWGGEKHWGIEYNGFRVLSVRFGAHGGRISSGIGLHFLIFQIDYAFISAMSDDLGSLHRIGFTMSF